jgi:integrase
MIPQEFLPSFLFQEEHLASVYTYCLSAFHPLRKAMHNGEVISLRPNEVLISRTSIPTGAAPNIDTFQDALNLLEKLDLICLEIRDSCFLVKFTKLPFLLESRYGLGQETAGESSPMTFNEYSSKYLTYVENNHAPKTLENAKRVLKAFGRLYGDIPIRELKSNHAEEFKLSRLDSVGVGKSTVNIDVRTLKSCLELAVTWSLLKENPFRKVKAIKTEKKKRPSFSSEEFQMFMSAVDNEQLKKLFVFAVRTGMRRGEILTLTWSNVDFEKKLITIESNAEYRTKMGQTRVVPFASDTTNLLNSLRENDPYVFMQESGKRFSEDFITKQFKRFVRLAGLDEGLCFHCLRGTAASWWSDGGATSFQIKQLLGHAYVKTTENYVNPAIAGLRKVVEGFSP